MARRLVLRMGFSHFLVATNLLIQPQAFRSPSGVHLHWLLHPLQCSLPAPFINRNVWISTDEIAYSAFFMLTTLTKVGSEENARQLLVAHGPDPVGVGQNSPRFVL